MNEKILIREDKNGTKYYHNRCTCGKCGGTGMIDYYRPVNGGVCFDCDGAGWVEYDTKEYTPEHEEKLRQQAEKRRERKIAKEKEQAAEKNAEFFKKQGFNPEGKTYVVLGNTYDIKEELKAQGAKWDNLSRHWHMPTPPEGREYLELTVDDMYDANYAGVYEWTSWKRFGDTPEENENHYTNVIARAEDRKKVQESTSEHVGNVGDKLTIEAKYVHTASWENGYGGWLNHASVTNLHTFKDEQGNVFVWKTGTFIKADYDTKMKITGTVKEHSEYKGIKQTVLTRCKIEEVKA